MSFWGELKRRNVVRVGIAYLVGAWLVIQVAATFFPALRLPSWTVTFVAALLILGFPIALIVSWAYELTPEGLRKSRDVPLADSITPTTGRKIDRIIIVVLALAVVLLVADNYLLERVDSELAREPPTVVDSNESSSARSEASVLPNSVAVLPLENLSPDEDDAYFAAGMHEEILNQLAKLRNLTVISRTTMMQYANQDKSIPEIARELNVETVMEGSVRYANDRIMVTIQLIDPATDAHLWSDSYPGDLSDIFAIQADIAMNVANALQAEFSLEEQESIERIPTESLEAYELFLAAQAMANQANVMTTDEPLAAVGAALEIDPEFARAWALQANLSSLRAQASDRAENARLIELAYTSASRATELEPDLVEAQVMLAATTAARGDFAGAERAYRRVPYTLNPAGPATYGIFLMSVGEFGKARDQFAEVRQRDPLNELNRGFYALSLALEGDERDAEVEFDRMAAVFGEASFSRALYSALAYLGSSRAERAEDFLNNAVFGSLDASNAQEALRSARTVLNSDASAIAALSVVGVAAGALGDTELAFDLVAEATRLSGTNALHFWLPSMIEVRRLPQFKPFVREIGLVDYWNEFGWPAICQPLEGNDFECS